MMRARFLGPVALVVAAISGPLLAGDDDAAPSQPQPRGAAVVALTTVQRDGAGIAVARPAVMQLPGQIAAFGLVLDPSVLVSESGQVEAALASERAASANLERLQGLYRAEAASSLKMVQTAQSEQIHARSEYRAALSAFTSHWGALAKLPAAERGQIIERAASGSHLLVHASLLGRRSLDATPVAASVDVDGVRIPARVVGVLPRSSSEFQNAGLLLEVSAAPQGLGPGARVPVTLMSAQRTGVLIPDDAIVYGEHGPRVFKQLAAGAAQKWRYVDVPIELLERQSQGWLVHGVAIDDLIVVRGAGALWSLQSANVLSADEDDD